jgi:signal transduction histidine kinase
MGDRPIPVRDVLGALPQPAYLARLEGDDFRIVVANEAAARLMRRPRAEVEGRLASELIPPEPAKRLVAQFRRALDRGAPISFDHQATTVAGEFRLSASPVRWDAREIIVSLEDITARNRLEQRARLADRLYAVAQLAAGVAHEINNPLAYVLSNLEFMLDELSSEGADPTGQLRAAASDARDGAQRVRRIVRDLKLFSRPDEERAERVELPRLLESCLKVTANELRHRARVETSFEHELPPVSSSPARLSQVFVQLLLNAAQAGRAEENLVRVVARAAADRRHVVVEVSDTGSGIPDDERQRIFDPFYTTKSVGSGTGLGLSICHGIVTALGGEIDVESTVGQGSMFRVTLPALAEAAEEASSHADERLARYLIVDDEALVGSALARLLSPAQSVCVTSARAALQALDDSGDGFDAVLCDLMMPEISGPELVELLRDRHPRLAGRTILLTGGAFTADARDFVERSGLPLLEKPFTRDQVRAALAKLDGTP